MTPLSNRRPRLRAALLAGVVATGLAGGAAYGFADVPPPVNQNMPAASMQALPSFHPILERVMPAVVTVSVEMKTQQTADEGDGPSLPGIPEGTPFDDMLRHFFDQQMPPGARPMPRHQGHEMALGSGFIIDPSGYVVTNNHVAGNAAKVTVTLQDGTKHTAKVIGTDEKTDLALLKITADKPLPYVKFGDSDKAQVGDWIVAVGNPFGLGGTVTSGIISARGRDINSGPYDDFLQLDAPINRGNSGGPTFNLAGDVIGINTAIFSPNGGSVGIGFAIPSNLAQTVIAQLKDHGKVTRGWLGAEIQQITPELARSLGLKGEPNGALVAKVVKGSPAAKAGLKQGDVVESFDGHRITRMHDLPLTVAATPVGRTADMTVLRQGREETLHVTVAELPSRQNLAQDEDRQQATPGAFGLNLDSLGRSARQEFHIPAGIAGALVRNVEPGSAAEEAGLQPGDVIQQVNQQPTPDARSAEQLLKEAAQQKQALLLVNRGGQQEFVALDAAGNQG